MPEVGTPLGPPRVRAVGRPNATTAQAPAPSGRTVLCDGIYMYI